MKRLSKSIVFITGAFLSNHCWDEWKSYFESEGYHCIAPAWPNKEYSPEDLRNSHPNADIASNRLRTVMDYFISIISGYEEEPILIGHSLGGLIVQLLLQRDLGVAGVAIHSFPPRGVCGRLSFLRTLWKAAGFFSSTGKSYMISFKRWKYRFANGLACEQQIEFYYAYAVPESKMIIRDCLAPVTSIKFNNVHQPLLFTSGNRDLIIPASLNYDNYKKFETGHSITCYKEFKDHNHLVFGNPVWKEEAEFILGWLRDIK